MTQASIAATAGAIALALTSAHFGTLEAAPITFHYAAKLVERFGSDPCGPALLGRDAQIAITLNAHAPDTTPEPEFGDYPGAITAFLTTFAGRQFLSSSGNLRIELPPASPQSFYAFRPSSDPLLVSGPLLPGDCRVSEMGLTFYGPIAPRFVPNDRIPFAAPDPTGFDEANFGLTFCSGPDCANGRDIYRFTVITEPPLTLLLCCIGMLLGIMVRRPLMR